MTDDKRDRIVAHTFQQVTPGDLQNESLGRATFAHRDEPGDVWGPPREVAPMLNYQTWVEFCEGQGFTHEERES